MTSLTFEISGRVASAKNSSKRFKAGNRTITVKSDAAQAWHAHAVAELLQQRPVMRAIACPVAISIQFHGPIDHQWSVDGDNGEGAIFDALRKAKIIADDKPLILRRGTWEWLDAPTWKVVLMLEPYTCASVRTHTEVAS
jgi:Holliday junction resolvase RusA-like endonuclease